ncbi:MAG: VanZ family protein [Chloroflexota bacterium]
MALIYWLSSQPELPTLAPAGYEQALTTLAHLGEYGVLGALGWWAAGVHPPRASARALLLLALATVYGLSDEWHQSFVPGRTAESYDVVVDGAGAALGLLIAKRLETRRWTERR